MSMTRTQAKIATLLTAFPSLVVVVILAPLFWLIGDRSGYDWLFWVYVLSIPVGFVAGICGLFFAFQSFLTRARQVALCAVNGASMSVAVYWAVQLWKGITALKGLGGM
jgi:hypothetical protein